MSLENDFLVFAGASGANVLTQADYAAASATATGYVSGVASSAAVNKTLRQASIMSSMIAQFIVDKAVQPVIDDGTIATIETNFEAAILAIAETVNIPISQVTGLATALAGYLPLHATADAAAKLATARNISLIGAVTGAVNFDGSSNVAMTTTFGNIAASTLLGNPTGASAAPTTITLANGLQFSSGVLGMAAITPTSVTASGGISSATISTTGAAVFNSSNSTSSAGLEVYTGYGQLIARGATGVNYWDSVNTANSAYQALQISANGITLASTLTVNGLATFSTGITVNGALARFTNALLAYGTQSSYPTQGGYLAWNQSDGIGEMDFINNQGGGAGGFNWYNTSGAGTSLTTSATLSGGGNFVAGGTVRGGSDARIKVEVEPIIGALDLVCRYLVGVTYRRTDNGQHEAGFLGQAVEEGLPLLVGIEPELNGIKNFRTVDYMHATAYLAPAIKELREEVNELRRRIEA